MPNQWQKQVLETPKRQTIPILYKLFRSIEEWGMGGIGLLIL